MIYTVKPGDSLSKIAAANGFKSWQEVWKANPGISNPNLIKPGQQINLPERGAPPQTQPPAPPAGSLEKTLPPMDSGLPTSAIEKSLPAQSESMADQTSPLTNLRLALRDISSFAYSKNSKGQLDTTFKQLEKIGVKPENVRGGTVGNIIDMVSTNVETPIQKGLSTMSTVLQDIEKQKTEKLEMARTNLNAIQNMITESNKGWDTIPDELKKDILKLEKDAGLPQGSMEAFTRAKPKSKVLSTSQGYDASGQEIVSFIYEDENGNPGVVKTVKTGGVRAPQQGPGNPQTSNKPISESTRNKFFLPSTVTQGEFNTINDSLKSYVNSKGGVTNENRFKLWDDAVRGIQSMEIDPSDYDALLWDYFHPEGLQGYQTHRLGKAEKKSGKLQLDAAAVSKIMAGE